MFNINKATLLGRLTADPVIKTLPSGRQIARFSIATNRYRFNPETKERIELADFHNVIAWGKLAEVTGKYLKKGEPIYIEGRLQTRKWEDKNNQKHNKTEIVIENLILLGSVNPVKSSEEDIDTEEIPFE